MKYNLLLQKEYENLINKLSIGTDNGNIAWNKYYDEFYCTIKDRVFKIGTFKIHWMIEGFVCSIYLTMTDLVGTHLDTLQIRTNWELEEQETGLLKLLINLYNKLVDVHKTSNAMSTY